MRSFALAILVYIEFAARVMGDNVPARIAYTQNYFALPTPQRQSFQSYRTRSRVRDVAPYSPCVVMAFGVCVCVCLCVCSGEQLQMEMCARTLARLWLTVWMVIACCAHRKCVIGIAFHSDCICTPVRRL